MSMDSVITISAPPVTRKWVGWWIVPVVVAVALGLAAVKFRPWSRGDEGMGTAQFYTVLPLDLEIKIVKDGELQAVHYTDVESKVEGAAQIIWLVKEGATVKKGDELVKLDASALQQRKEQMDVDLQTAEANLKNAEEMMEIRKDQNAADLDAVTVSRELAKLDLKKYAEGTYPQQLADAETARDMAKILLKNKQEDLQQTKALFEKGFVTAMDVKKAELEVRSQTNEVLKTERAVEVLQKYTYPMQLEQLKSQAAQAQQTLLRTVRLNASYLAQRRAELVEKQTVLAHMKKHAEKLQEQIENSTIRAPEDGLVIYMSTIDRSMREPIQEGTMVRYTQSLMRLPDVSRMKVVMKIQEALKPRLDVNRNQRAIVKILGVEKPVGATLTKVSVLPDNSQRWWNPDLKEYPIELTLDETPSGMKPGTRADAEILLDRIEDALAVPLAAIYTVGTDSYVFVRTPDGGVRERKVTVATANETHVQVTDGLSENEQVLILQAGQGRALLEKAGIKTDDPTTRPVFEAGRMKARAGRVGNSRNG